MGQQDGNSRRSPNRARSDAPPDAEVRTPTGGTSAGLAEENGTLDPSGKSQTPACGTSADLAKQTARLDPSGRLRTPDRRTVAGLAGGALRDAAFGLGLIGYAARKRSRRTEGLRARNGAVGALTRRAPGPRILLHGVSVGEVVALEPLARELAASAAQPDVVVSASTATGFAHAQELYADLAPVVRFPLDFTWMVRRFLDGARPALALLGELELWPSFMIECRRRGIPVGVVNGRLSDRSFRAYRRGRPLVKRMFAGLALAVAQTPLYRERFAALGVPEDRIAVGGSLKWDAARKLPDRAGAEKLARALGLDRERPLVVAGSTGPGEEEALVRARPPGCQLLLAPRSQDRWDEVAKRIPGVVRRSRAGEGSRRPAGARVFLLDTIGELPQAYALADVAFVGRSLSPLGGSNPLEPVALAKPTIIGPRHENFAEIVERLADGGGIVVSRDPMAVAARWLADRAEAERVATAGRQALERNLGTAKRQADLALALLDPGARGRGRVSTPAIRRPAASASSPPSRPASPS